MRALVTGLLTDHAGMPSSKRLVGVVGAFVLYAVFILVAIAAVILALRHKQPIVLDGVLTASVVGLVMGALGLTSWEKRPAERAQAEIAVRRATGQTAAIPEGSVR